PQLIAMLKEWGESFKLIDERPLIRPKYKVNSLNGIIFRDYQREAVLAVGKSKINGLHFPICNISAATNAGKSIISAGIHAMYDSKTLFLINSKELLKEAEIELPKLLPNKVGYLMSGKPIQWNDFMVVMVKTLFNKITGKDQANILTILKEYKVCLIDEGDLATSKTYQKVISYLFHCPVRVGLSGTMWV